MPLEFTVSLTVVHFPGSPPQVIIALNLVFIISKCAVLTMSYFSYSYLHHIGAFTDSIQITFLARECCCCFFR